MDVSGDGRGAEAVHLRIATVGRSINIGPSDHNGIDIRYGLVQLSVVPRRKGLGTDGKEETVLLELTSDGCFA